MLLQVTGVSTFIVNLFEIRNVANVNAEVVDARLIFCRIPLFCIRNLPQLLVRHTELITQSNS
jgi:hypothetical protein